MVHKIYAKRQKELRGEIFDVFQYDVLPKPLRIQVKFLIDNVLGNETEFNLDRNVRSIYDYIYNILREEIGTFDLNNKNALKEKINLNSYEELRYFLVNERDTEYVLSYIELAFVIAKEIEEVDSYKQISHDDKIKTLNERFKENGVGFTFEENQLIRIDSKLLHKEVIQPTLKLLNSSGYEVIQDYYLKAYDHFRTKKYNEAIIECNKAFESTMKVICKQQFWELKGHETASKLIDICLKNELIPNYWQTQLSSLKSMLSSGIPNIRNKYSHGDDQLKEQAPEELVSYILHSTGSTIIFLIESQKRLK
ncbi:hypothetical protein CWC28_18590 [Pseudoalteromonas sp. S4492]|uniref:STM4504/CBY_0614 family protein n=1 Tax=Pseudoalteromonas sp. S4492 TaxID=579560 RepID=UPI00110B7E7A|nr:hypothetical protein [Pseudoalteromonas sp. S4492]TMO24146.1 hypothetical protein CWC28_18590 [Pseudoalteromonas sp. S4492]